MIRVLSIYLPTWPIDRLRRRDPSRDVVWLLVTTSHGRQIVAHRCERAARAGVQPGMTLAHARALLPGAAVEVAPYESEADAAALRALARWAVRFSPLVAADPPDGLLIDVTGCQRLYGNERRMIGIITAAIEQHGLTVQATLAPTIGSAWALARYGADQTIIETCQPLPPLLAPLPIEALRVDEATIAALAEVAVDRIGQLYDLPRTDLAARYGRTLLGRLDQALGRVFEPIEPQRPAPPPQAQRTFAGPVTQLEAVELTVYQLLIELAAQLQRHESGVRCLVLRFDRMDAARITQTVQLSRPSREVQHLWKLLQPAVEKINLGYGVERVTLTASKVGRLRHEQVSCWQTGEASDAPTEKAAGELVDQLVGRLGEPRVSRIEPAADHVPEWSFELTPVSEKPGRAADGKSGRSQNKKLRQTTTIDNDGSIGDRPSIFLARPMPVQVTLLTPDGPIMSIRGRQDWRRVITTIGPERIRMPWWRRATVGRATRDYFKVQDEAGQWWWLYRQLDDRCWFMHGRWE